MTDVAIDELSLHIVRRGGWCWGAPRDRLIDAAMRALPGLIGRALAHAVAADDADGELGTLHVRVPMSVAELLALPVTEALDEVPAEAVSALERRLRSAVARALAAARPVRGAAVGRGGAGSSDDRVGEVAAVADGVGAAARLAGALARWHAAGDLPEILARLGPGAVIALYARVLAATGLDEPTAAAAFGGIGARPDDASATAEARAGASAADAAAIEVVRARVVAIARGLAETPRADLRAVVARVIPAHPLPARARGAFEDAAPEAMESDVGAPVAIEREDARRASGRPGRHASVRSLGTVDVPHALPFLLLVPLSRIGYFDVATAGLAAAECEADAAAFGAALAYKVLDPVARGWRRTDESRRSAAAFAASADLVSDDDIAGLARRLADVAPAMDLALGRALARGAGDAPRLCLGPGGAGLILGELDGAVPIGTASTWSELAPLVRPDALVFVAPEVASPAVLAAIDAGGHTFVTAAAPARGETWRALRQPGAPRLWTNDRDSDERTVRRRAAAPIDAAAEIAALLDDVGPTRPAIPHGAYPHPSPPPRGRERREESLPAWGEARWGGRTAPGALLDVHLTLAAASALAITAWQLWRDREPTIGQLTLTRLGDLEARVTFDDDSVRVALPLGRRYQDLHDRGLLADVRGVPWLGDRVVTFGWA